MFLVDGPQENIKITTPDDFYTMRALLDAKENAQIYGYEE
jgi:2-C-methyl-D-erythritol 4-phosphate cytidylyltransferase